MTREAFIRKWLANPQKQYNEQCRDEMRDDLDKVIDYAQQQVKNLNIPAVIKSVCPKCGSKYYDEDNNVKRCQDCYTVY